MKYFKNTSWLFFGKILQMAVSLFVGVYVIRYLGPSRYGTLSYALAFVGMFSVFSSLGLDSILVRELVKTPEKRAELLGTAFVFKLIGTGLMFIAIFIGIQFTNNDSFTNLLIAIIATGYLFSGFKVINLNFQANVQSRYVVQIQIIQLVISSIIRLSLIWISAQLLWFALITVSDAIIFATGLVWNYLRKVGHSRWLFKRELAKTLLKDSWPLILSGVAVSIYMKIDKVMIQNMLGSSEVGQYAAAVKLSEAWYIIPVVISTSLFPAIINAKKVSETLYNERLQKLYSFMIWMAIAIALPMTFLSDRIVNLLYGNQYNQAGSVLMIHIWAGIFVFLGVASSKWLLTENLQIFSIINKSIGAVSNVVLNFILIPKIGIKGAAWATLISYFIAAYLSLSFWKKTRINFINLSKAFIIRRSNV